MSDCVELGEEIAALATQVNVATHALLTRIRRFDEAEGWGEQGAKSCAHWLTWRIGLDPATAREKVRVARALGALPKIDEALAEGRLSYAKVRALTRFATAESEDNALAVAMAATGAQLERICQRLRRASDGEREMAEARRFRARAIGEGLVRLEIVLSADEADLVVQSVERARERATNANDRPRPTAADGLMNVVSSYLAGGGEEADGALARGGEVVVHLEKDPTAPGFIATLEDGTSVSAEALRRVSCDSGLVAAALDAEGAVLDVGRRSRAIPTAIRRALWIRDRGCRFPGCSATRFLHGHHVQHWLHGGRTSLDNLLVLCSFHHRLVHEGGFSVALDDAGAVIVSSPTGRRVSAETSDAVTVEWPALRWSAGERITIPIPTGDGDPVDYDSAADALWPAYEDPMPCSTPASQ